MNNMEPSKQGLPDVASTKDLASLGCLDNFEILSQVYEAKFRVLDHI